MNVLIIEDEKLAQDYLESLLIKTGFDITVIGRIDSVKNGIKWFLKNPEPDLVFMDIDLGDGLCFEIFEVVEINCPIIFTTAYDEYAIQAFKVNSVDYLLKPIEIEELVQALEKMSKWNVVRQKVNIGVLKAGKLLSRGYKERFIIKIGDHLKTVPVHDVLYFISQDKITFAHTKAERKYPLDFTLDRLEEILNPSGYYRINRKYIISYQAIKDMVVYSNSRLKIKLAGSNDEEIIVARDRVSTFKDWLDR